MSKTLRRTSRGKHPRNHESSIPTLLRRIRGEKISETIPVKLQPSLKRFIKQTPVPVSTFVRNLIISELQSQVSENMESDP